MTATRTQPRMRETKRAPGDHHAGPGQVARGAAHPGAGSPGPRMGPSVDAAQAARRDVRVDLRRRQVGVAEELLDDPQVGAAVEEVRGERVAQRVRATHRPAGRPGPRPGAAGSGSRATPSGAPAVVDEERVRAARSRRRRGASRAGRPSAR